VTRFGLRKTDRAVEKPNLISPRELTVLDCLAQGLACKQIGG
jgi:DNA-binding NarL/FixJ family response regulator